jgi:hypothetical protein
VTPADLHGQRPGSRPLRVRPGSSDFQDDPRSGRGGARSRSTWAVLSASSSQTIRCRPRSRGRMSSGPASLDVGVVLRSSETVRATTLVRRRLKLNGPAPAYLICVSQRILPLSRRGGKVARLTHGYQWGERRGSTSFTTRSFVSSSSYGALRGRRDTVRSDRGLPAR